MAHEFTHLIHLNEGGTIDGANIHMEDVWVDEGVAEYAIFIYDGMHTSNVDEFILAPQTPLVKKGNFPPPNYGASYLFIFYMLEHYGKPSIQLFLRNFVRDKANGIEGIDNALKGFGTNFLTVFLDWTIANYLDKTKQTDGTPFNEGKWGYFIDNDLDSTNDIKGLKEKLPVALTEKIGLGAPGIIRTNTLKPWGSDYYLLKGHQGSLNIGFDGSDGGQFKCGLIKLGSKVEPSAEYIFLDQRQAGNLVVHEYGRNDTYDSVMVIPTPIDYSPASAAIVSDVSGRASVLPLVSDPQNYIFSATFQDLKVAIFPNPIFENGLHVLVHADAPFTAPPLLQISYGLSIPGYLTMEAVDKKTYIANYTITKSAEGLLESSATTETGLNLSNRLKFSAIYYSADGPDLATSSFANLAIPTMAIKQKGLVVLSGAQGGVSLPGLTGVSLPVLVSIPTKQAAASLTLEIPVVAAGLASDGKLGLFEITPTGGKLVSMAGFNGKSASGQISRGGTFLLAVDTTPPIIGKSENPDSGEGTLIEVSDRGSGIDPGSLSASCEGRKLPVRYDEKAGLISVATRGLPAGSRELKILVSDLFGNWSEGKISARVPGTLIFGDLSLYPNPARQWVKFRAVFSGALANSLLVDFVVRDSSGDEVTSGTLSSKGNGVYETTWNLRNDSGKGVANGVYIFETQTSTEGSRKVQKKFAILR